MKTVILDTNFLMIPIKFRIDIFSEIHRLCDFEYELCIIDKTIDELKIIAEIKKGIDKKAAKFGLVMAKKKGFGIIESDLDYVDDAILKNAGKNTIVATNDSDLKKKLLRKGIPVIIMRQKSYLMFAPFLKD